VRRVCLLALFGVLVTGCGSRAGTTGGSRGAPETLQQLGDRAGTVVPLVAGTGDLATGLLRYTFLVVAADGRTVDRPRATVWRARGRDRPPLERAAAHLESVGTPETQADAFEAQSQYVTYLDVRSPGTYWLLARPGGARTAALGQIRVKAQSASPAVGAAAPRSRTPTLATTGGRLEPLTTASKPDRLLYVHSVAGSLRAHVPFVVAFATPAFCASRTCGPVVDVVSAVRRGLGDSGVRFIHAEVYKDNDPTKGYNRWMGEWHLQSEPWVFLVGADGRVDAKFEGAVSVRELRAAVQRHLMR
jgi:hypothetical protein